MASFKLLLVIAVVACCLVQLHEAQTCTATSSITTCQIPVTFYDHAPAWMEHSRWNPQWWNVKVFYDYPFNGSCGTANNSHGWANSDFELPLFVLQGPAVCCSTTQFNLPIINGEKGLVGKVCTSATDQSSSCGRLGADQTPQYAYSGQSPYGEVSSPQSFYTFFHNVEQTFPVPYNLTLTQDRTQSNLRSFNNFSFFPLDGLGWNDYSSSYDVNGNFQKHNYAFCMVMNTHFTYGGGEYFDFLGDDDVYAYINGFLVMDLGGVHTALNASIRADSLGLTKQTTYRFDLFYCERHTTSSEIKFSTTINFFCAYNDWCGVCDGNGQSCCNGACNDTDLCTTDTCGVQIPPPNGCVHTPVSCPPSTPCINSFCDPNTGNCVTTQVNCNDGNACTTDTCGSSGCVHTPINCASTNQCVTTGCDPATGCTTQPVSCTTSNKCQNSTCASNVGCINTNIPCSTANKCYTATCTPSSGCQITPNAPCNDNNQCTTDSCNAQTGCVFTPNNITSQCGVSDKCTQYFCNPQTGCGSTKTVCTSPDACHTAVCVPSTGCQILPNVTCTGNACGTSACNPTTGACVYTPNAPCAPKTCYNATCNNSTGCQYSAATCTPTQACYSGVCVNNQCNFTYTQGAPGCGNCGTATCNVSNPCNPQVCQNGKCVNQPVNCNDYNACTNDTCVVSPSGQAQCQNTPIVCNAGNPCNPQSCSPINGACISNPVICNDGNPCTTDQCVVLGSSYSCNFAAIQCNATSDPFCNPVECHNGTCVNAPPPNCSDGNACTYDECTNGSCSNPPVCPSAGTLCDPITCVNGTCITQPVNCSSGNLCSIDSCDPTTGNCLHIPKNCNGTICSPSSCNLTTGQCEAPQLLNCNAGNNPCALGTRTCDPILGFGCNYTDLSYECDSHSACILDFCNSSMTTATNTSQACYHQNVNCTAPTICQVVAGCNAVNGCVYTPKICPAPLNKCMVAICDEIAGCLTVDKACAPQDNFCYAGTCNNLTGVCGQVQRPNWQLITNQQGVTCLLAYNTAAKAGLTAGIIAAIVIAAVVAAALIAIAGKKGVDVFLASRAAPIGAASNNPLYVQTAGAGENALYAGR